MKNSSRFFGLLFAVSLAAPVHAGWSDYLYFLRYVAANLLDRSPSKQIKPFDIPAIMPAPEKIAQDIKKQVDADSFLVGASTSEHQCSQICTPEICSWSRFAQDHDLPQPEDKKNSMNLWKHYRSYFDYAANHMKLNSLRFSIEWPLVQPNGPNSWDQKTLDHYADMFIQAVKRGIAPVVCFHHYTDPNWFLDRGGFEKDENVDYFVEYATRVYEHIMQKVSHDADAIKAIDNLRSRKPLWATFNAPAGYAFRGYRQKQGPPADPQRAGLPMVAQVFKNTLEAHTGVYHALKQVAGKFAQLQEPSVGILKNIHQIDASTDTWAHYVTAPITRAMAAVADMIQNGSFYGYFNNGEYRVHVPFAIDTKHSNPKAKGALDFIGLNYYSNRHLYFTKTVEQTDPELCSDNRVYYRYPQGIYRAIVELDQKLVKPYQKQLGRDLPLIVAENGIATLDNEKRRKFYHEYLYAINRAVQDGHKVYGYLPWTLADNYEWPSTENNRPRAYGLCAVDEQDQSKLIAKNGSRSYLDFVKEMANNNDKQA